MKKTKSELEKELRELMDQMFKYRNKEADTQVAVYNGHTELKSVVKEFRTLWLETQKKIKAIKKEINKLDRKN